VHLVGATVGCRYLMDGCRFSVLEVIFGVSFPVKINPCTRFPAEVILRQASQFSATFRSESEQQACAASTKNCQDSTAYRRSLRKQKLPWELGLTEQLSLRAFSELEHSFRWPASNHDRSAGVDPSRQEAQSSYEAELVKELVDLYTREVIIILAVVFAKNDFVNQVVVSLPRDADKNSSRLLGVSPSLILSIQNPKARACNASLIFKTARSSFVIDGTL